MKATASIVEVITAATPGTYIVANDLLDGTMDVLLWETEADWENDDGARAIGRWVIADDYTIIEGAVDEDTFG